MLLFSSVVFCKDYWFNYNLIAIINASEEYSTEMFPEINDILNERTGILNLYYNYFQKLLLPEQQAVVSIS